MLHNADLLHTSSWANTYLDRDHHAPQEPPAGNRGSRAAEVNQAWRFPLRAAGRPSCPPAVPAQSQPPDCRRHRAIRASPRGETAAAAAAAISRQDYILGDFTSEPGETDHAANLPEVPAAIEIARRASLRPITEIAAELNIPADDLELYGKYKAKVSLDLFHRLRRRAGGKLILVTAITPRRRARARRRRASAWPTRCGGRARRPPSASGASMGPCFGMKAGRPAAAIPGRADGGHQPPLHRRHPRHQLALICGTISTTTSITATGLGLDVRRLQWGRVVDMNDRALRSVTVGLGGPNNGVPRKHLRYHRRIGGHGHPVPLRVAHRIETPPGADRGRANRRPQAGHGRRSEGPRAMAVLLKDAIKPNLVRDARTYAGSRPRRAVRQHRTLDATA